MEINWMEQIFTLIGGLGLFLLGMKTMSEGLQAAAGNRIKRIFDLLTTNRVMGVLVGLSVTAIIQSSSATTVMVVGFVNAGLMDLSQAAGIIMGANIGTTVTGWIIAIKITRYALPILAVGVGLMMFSKNRTLKNTGNILMGFGMLFFGLKLMEMAFHPLRDSKEFIEFFMQFGAENYLQILKSVAAGCLLTMIIQSSSATMGITIALANQGLLSYAGAAALVLGENIGTTITALLASMGTNVTARRAARFHMLFNLIGVCYMLLVFKGFVHLVDWVMPGGMDYIAADGTKPYIAAHIAAGHSIFNIFNTIIFLPLAGLLIRAATFIVPGEKEGAEKHLEFIDYSFISTPSIALSQAKKEIMKMFNMVLDMFKWTEDFMSSPSSKGKQVERLFKYENITDEIQKELTQFLAKILRGSPGELNAEEARRYTRIADEIESIGDYCERLTKYYLRAEEHNLAFSAAALEALEKIHREVWEYLELASRCFIDEKPRYIHEADARRDVISALVKRQREAHMERMNRDECEVVAGMLFNDLLTGYKGIVSHAHNITETVAGRK
ncbi:MAG: Na/Pi cotransporter family protein [bacterium]